MFDSSSLLLIFIPLGVEKTGRQNANESDTMAAESMKPTNDVDNKIEVVDDGARNVDKVQGPVKEIDVDGAQVIRNQSSLLPLSASYGLGVEKICQLIASKICDTSCSLSHYHLWREIAQISSQ
jgi:hypothetical protein